MKHLDPALAKIRSTRGLPVRVAEALGITRSSIYQWRAVPIARVHEVARVINMPAEEIRPDVFRPKGRRR